MLSRAAEYCETIPVFGCNCHLASCNDSTDIPISYFILRFGDSMNPFGRSDVCS